MPDPKTMTLDEIIPILYPGAYRGKQRGQFSTSSRSGWWTADHSPFEPTLDEAARLPEGWTWTIEPDYEASCRETRGECWVAYGPNDEEVRVARTHDEKLDRFRLRVACEMADKGEPHE